MKALQALRVKDILKDQGRSQVWLAGRLGMDSTTLSHILSGYSRYRVTTQLKAKIAEILGIPYAMIYGEEQEEGA